ncbi:MAG: ATP-binding protein [Flammeovirgaceae bacterium]
MDFSSLLRLVAQGESQTLDFKKTIHPRKIAKTLVSFANTNGGKIIVGVTDSKHIVGVDVEEERYQIDEACQHFCDPKVEVEYHRVEDENGKTVLVVMIPESVHKPHKAIDRHDEWKVYVRMNDKSVEASKAIEKNLGNSSTIQKSIRKPANHLEKALFDYLNNKERITIKQFAKLVNISNYRSKKILVSLSLEGVLFEHDFEKEVFYSLANKKI